MNTLRNLAEIQTKYIINLTWLNLIFLSLGFFVIDTAFQLAKRNLELKDLIFNLLFWPVLFTFYRGLFRRLFPQWIKEKENKQ